MQRQYADEDLINKTPYYLTFKSPFIRISRTGQKRRYWECECVCGTKVMRREKDVINGRTKSCGCKHPLKGETLGAAHPLWRGCGELSHQHFGAVRCRAIRSGIAFEITIEEAWALFETQSRQCALTGLPIQMSTLRGIKRGIEQTASLDRINSDLGYVPGNVQWIHKDVNKMKNAFPQERFIEICRLVIERQTGKMTSTVEITAA